MILLLGVLLSPVQGGPNSCSTAQKTALWDWFFSAFLSGVEIGFSHSVFLEPTSISSIAHCLRVPMLLAKVTVFLSKSFFQDFGCNFSTRLLHTLLLAVQSFLVRRSIGSFLATYMLNSLERQEE